MSTVSIRNEDSPGHAVSIRPSWLRVKRKELLKASKSAVEVYGLDMTAGCIHGCAFCHIRGGPAYPGEGRTLFDPDVANRLRKHLDALDDMPRQVVLSPSSDPLPPFREIRAATHEALRILLERGIQALLMTRGRVNEDLVKLLAEHSDRVRVAIGITTLDRKLGRTLEPWSAPPWRRLRAIRSLVNAGVDVEVRLEPLIPGLTDTRENLRPLFAAIGHSGARRVVSHYLFLHSSMTAPLSSALADLDLGDDIFERYVEGPAFHLGSIGMTRHLPAEERRAGLARLTTWGAEHGLTIETGATQNPDFRRLEPSARPRVEPPSPVVPHAPVGRAITPAMPGPTIFPIMT